MTERTLDDCPDLTSWTDEIRTGAGADPAALVDDLLEMVTEGINAHPRSAQTEIGPSEVGHPCNRWLAHHFANTPRRERPPMWRAAVGTAVDGDLKGWAHRWNEQHDTVRYLTDLLVHVGDLYGGRPVFGTLDLLDLWTATVIDLKVPGPSSMKKHKTAHGGPERDETYRMQKQLYARGCANAGFTPRHVGILRLPSAGELADAIWTFEAYRPDIAEQALTRAGGIARMVEALGTAAIPLQPTVEKFCTSCAFFDPHTKDLRTGCPGAEKVVERRSTPPQYLSQLIA